MTLLLLHQANSRNLTISQSLVSKMQLSVLSHINVILNVTKVSKVRYQKRKIHYSTWEHCFQQEHLTRHRPTNCLQ